MKHFRDKSDSRRLIWVFFCEFYCKFESSWSWKRDKQPLFSMNLHKAWVSGIPPQHTLTLCSHRHCAIHSNSYILMELIINAQVPDSTSTRVFPMTYFYCQYQSKGLCREINLPLGFSSREPNPSTLHKQQWVQNHLRNTSFCESYLWNMLSWQGPCNLFPLN